MYRFIAFTRKVNLPAYPLAGRGQAGKD